MISTALVGRNENWSGLVPRRFSVSLSPMELPGTRIRKIRNSRYIGKKPMSLKQLSERTESKIDPSYIGRVERGEVEQPGKDFLKEIAGGLDVPVQEIADPDYYDQEVRDTAGSLVALIWADTSLRPEQKRKLEKCVRDVYLGGDQRRAV